MALSVAVFITGAGSSAAPATGCTAPGRTVSGTMAAYIDIIMNLCINSANASEFNMIFLMQVMEILMVYLCIMEMRIIKFGLRRRRT